MSSTAPQFAVARSGSTSFEQQHSAVRRDRGADVAQDLLGDLVVPVVDDRLHHVGIGPVGDRIHERTALDGAAICDAGSVEHRPCVRDD